MQPLKPCKHSPLKTFLFFPNKIKVGSLWFYHHLVGFFGDSRWKLTKKQDTGHCTFAFETFQDFSIRSCLLYREAHNEEDT